MSIDRPSASLRDAARSSEAGPIEALVHAVLYEGYALYPYRPSSLKNQKRFAFGVIYPRAWAERMLEPSYLRVEVVATSPDVSAEVRFLRLPRNEGAREYRLVESATVDGIAVGIETTIEPAGRDLWRYAVEVRNESSLETLAAQLGSREPASNCETSGERLLDRESVMDVSPASVHVVLHGAFVSSIDPPPHAAAAVAACRSTGLYPILAGPGAMLASPIILPDYPEIAPQSPGDFFDGTEIDEMLTLRVLTMTAAEKAEAAAADPKIAALIKRTEELGIEQTAKLHGVVRTSWPRQGSRVRLKPTAAVGARRADAMDGLLAGKLATVASIERDFEGNIHCAVTLDDDPGADLGATGMPGHRFFFRPEELEVIA
jgi:hypothetical protein